MPWSDASGSAQTPTDMVVSTSVTATIRRVRLERNGIRPRSLLALKEGGVAICVTSRTWVSEDTHVWISKVPITY